MKNDIAQHRRNRERQGYLLAELAMVKFSLFFGGCQCWRVFSRNCPHKEPLDQQKINSALLLAACCTEFEISPHNDLRPDDIELIAVIRTYSRHFMRELDTSKITTIPRTWAH